MSPNSEKPGESAVARTGVLGSPGPSAGMATAGPWPPLMEQGLCSGHSAVSTPPRLITLFHLKASIVLPSHLLPIIAWELTNPCPGSVHPCGRKEGIIMHFDSLVGSILLSHLCPRFQSTLYVKIHLLSGKRISLLVNAKKRPVPPSAFSRQPLSMPAAGCGRREGVAGEASYFSEAPAELTG